MLENIDNVPNERGMPGSSGEITSIHGQKNEKQYRGINVESTEPTPSLVHDSLVLDATCIPEHVSSPCYETTSVQNMATTMAITQNTA